MTTDELKRLKKCESDMALFGFINDSDARWLFRQLRDLMERIDRLGKREAARAEYELEQSELEQS